MEYFEVSAIEDLNIKQLFNWLGERGTESYEKI